MPVQVIFSRNVIDQAAMERVYDGADTELMRIAKEIAAAAKENAPVFNTRPSTKKLAGKWKFKKGLRKRSKMSQRYGPLKGSIKAFRKGKRMKQNGRWRFLATRIAIRMAFYGKFLNDGFTNWQTGRAIEGSGFLTDEINRRLVRP